MSLNFTHQNSYQEYINNMSNEVMIRQKYESISQSEYSNPLGSHPQHNDNVEDYLNFGDNIMENYENIHGVKQEDLECDFLQGHEHKNQQENGMGFEQAHLPFMSHQQNGSIIDNTNFFLFKQQSIPQNNPTSSQGQQAPTQFDSSQLSAKMKRIMKREKAKSRRKMNLEQQQQTANSQETQFKSFIPTLVPSAPLVPQQNTEEASTFNKSTELSGQQQQIDMRSCSTSCSSNTAQFEVKLESSSSAGNQASANGINPAHLLEQKLKKSSSSSLSHEDLQLKALQQCQGSMDQKQQKKVMQMIRNRISAQNSRDRKKAYISKLEQDKEDFLLESIELRQQLNESQKEVANEKNKNELLQKEIQELKRKLQSQCKCFNTNPDKIESAQMNQTALNQKYSNHHSLQKNYAAFSVAFFAVLGVVLIFNIKPSKNEQAIINQSSQMMKMLDDLQKSTQDFQKMSQMRNEKDEVAVVGSAILNEKMYQKSDSKGEIGLNIEKELNNQAMEEEVPLQGEETPQINLNMLTKSDQIQKGQWIQFMVPKQENSLRDDVSRDSAETDVTHTNNNQKYLQVWAQIKSVNEFEQIV
ncbi:BZIP transcription factor family protein (macronuclear) [Tetrahymena thermophila SB210]|uniref:BZIP transcription factor family protein n=1 Tax=Tetrahymena thermophila (strain SB210) TaxID=312017 RepID=I7M050_TETTS|nr:BZIP transcription factor family protein [Tetrahymena thermophila SB210]EAR85491.2 BZIP transcription factor family protein [Tetrahymena thermophila SB210]|eukprot:XP_001033154.2 BZIP transcription factor family protein [Tetrahymena thermophila SB210]